MSTLKCEEVIGTGTWIATMPSHARKPLEPRRNQQTKRAALHWTTYARAMAAEDFETGLAILSIIHTPWHQPSAAFTRRSPPSGSFKRNVASFRKPRELSQNIHTESLTDPFESETHRLEAA